MSKHTPLPWGYSDHDFWGRKSEFDVYVSGDRHESDEGVSSVGIARVLGNSTSGDIAIENAKLICRAVNAHADLVAACEAGDDLSRWAAAIRWDEDETNTAEWLAELREKIERTQALTNLALSKAKGA